ncbi:MAG: fatty acid desaturase, partial [Bacteroidota bacterium]
VTIAFDVAIVLLLGWGAFAYLILSFMFSIGLHPLGARWIQEHYAIAPPQETYNYEGWMNNIQFNIGYHNEHHDFPGIPWNNLPKIRTYAPEYYENLVAHKSWSKLLWRWLTDKDLSLYARTIRKDARAATLRDREMQSVA